MGSLYDTLQVGLFAQWFGLLPLLVWFGLLACWFAGLWLDARKCVQGLMSEIVQKSHTKYMKNDENQAEMFQNPSKIDQKRFQNH